MHHALHGVGLLGAVKLFLVGFPALDHRHGRELDQKFKETGHENVYLPMLIPESLLTKE
mgnify:CR=1 FL=1